VARRVVGDRDGQPSAIGRLWAAVALRGVLLVLWGPLRGVWNMLVGGGVAWGAAGSRNGQPTAARL